LRVSGDLYHFRIKGLMREPLFPRQPMRQFPEHGMVNVPEGARCEARHVARPP